MSSEQYCKELSRVVALPAIYEGSLIGFAHRVRVCIESEQKKLSPDNAIISVLCDAARIGYEYGECAQGNKVLAQQLPTQPVISLALEFMQCRPCGSFNVHTVQDFVKWLQEKQQVSA